MIDYFHEHLFNSCGVSMVLESSAKPCLGCQTSFWLRYSLVLESEPNYRPLGVFICHLSFICHFSNHTNPLLLFGKLTSSVLCWSAYFQWLGMVQPPAKMVLFNKWKPNSLICPIKQVINRSTSQAQEEHRATTAEHRAITSRFSTYLLITYSILYFC